MKINIEWQPAHHLKGNNIRGENRQHESLEMKREIDMVD